MTKAIIVEDEIYIRKGLKTMINSLNKDITIVAECASVVEASNAIDTHKPDLVFLDINLTDGNAFDLLGQYQELNFNIIFITAYEEYALKALKKGAVDYILKPVDIDELETAIDKALLKKNPQEEFMKILSNRMFQQKKEKLILKLQEGLQIILIKSLMYCQSDKGYTTFYMSDGKSYLASKSIKEFEKELESHNFFRTHQSYIVNMDFVDRYDKTGYVILENKKTIPVSVRKKETFLTKLLNG
jgi:two-component system LytT family response regulator